MLGKLASEQGLSRSRCCDASEFEKTVLWFSGNRNRVLIIGDSHSKDLFNAFYLNPDLFEGFEFARYQINANDSPDQINDLLSSPNFRNADTVLLSLRHGDPKGVDDSQSQLRSLPKFVDVLRAAKPNIVIASATPVFMGATSPKTLFDEVFSARPDHDDDKSFHTRVNEKYFQSLKPEVKTRNRQVEKIAQEKGLKYLNKTAALCDMHLKQCFGVTPEGKKAFYDQAHWTLEGAKYFGERIYELNWLNTKQ